MQLLYHLAPSLCEEVNLWTTHSYDTSYKKKKVTSKSHFLA